MDQVEGKTKFLDTMHERNISSGRACYKVRILESHTSIPFIQSQGHKDFKVNIYYKTLIIYIDVYIYTSNPNGNRNINYRTKQFRKEFLVATIWLKKQFRQQSWTKLRCAAIWCYSSYSTCLSRYSAGFRSFWRHRSVCANVDAVSWSPLAHAPLMWRPCQVDHLTSLSVPENIASGPADDLVRWEVLDAFLTGRM